MLAVVIIFTKMGKDEIEFNKRKEIIDKFKNELKELIKKYNFGKQESDNYNGMEEYCGTDYYFTVNGETWYFETISEIMALK